jgi:coenzyme F420-reducing hydrogenase alpha subunit
VEHDGKDYLIGAIARVNNEKEKLNPMAYEYLASLNFKFPDYNPFHNILCQMVEVIHSIEEVRKLLILCLNSDLDKALSQKFEVREGVGVAAVEAPRGTLYYHLEIDSKGYVKNANIITPTAQSLANLEEDIAAFIPGILDLDAKTKEKKLRAFIRAYDPCISCAVH